MARNDNRVSFFDRLMNFADRFFEGYNKFKAMSAQAEKENVEFFNEKIPGYKESHDRSMQSAAKLGSKLESKVEKILFGKDLYLGAGGEARKAEDLSVDPSGSKVACEPSSLKKKPSLDNQIRSASIKANEQSSKDHGEKQQGQEHPQGR